MPELSPRLLQIVEALPLRPDLRVLEIGCGPGAMARELARRLPQGFVLGIDRSAKAIAQAVAGDNPPNLAFRQASADAFTLAPGEEPYDLAVAIRVGALDGRHPDLEQASRAAIRAALKAGGRLYIDGGDPLREIDFSAG
ncbi:MAG TPA: class I SAM-dependent methyltransferase [Devosiaceae bacterium]|jgi:trans-aconitate methyltransferase|nr:class I SAM-dependent methyltransferase [Devosiaceae bacterium]